MKQNVKMAKVISLKVKLSKHRIMNIVTAVDPSVTPEQVYSMCGVGGKIVSAEVTKEMPLFMALFESQKQQKQLGII